MTLELGLTDELCNTQYAPLAVLLAHYRQQERLKALQHVTLSMKTRDFTPADKLQQVLVSILAGCETLSEVNSKLKHEVLLAQVGRWPRFADQSTLSETLDALTRMNLTQLEGAVQTIWQRHSATMQHDWRGFLWLDFDLSGLLCSPQAEQSTKGYFSGKKTRRAAS